MNNRLTDRQRAHITRVKQLPCSVCDARGPSDAHHIAQSLQYVCIPLCRSCHMSGFNGIHGQARIWKVLKKSELSCLNDTIKRLLDGMV